MAIPNAERVKRWQSRTRLKAFFFDEMDKRRRRGLVSQFRSTVGHAPTIHTLRELFMASPRCFVAPAWVDRTEYGMAAQFPEGLPHRTGWEDTMATLAMREAGHKDAFIQHEGGRFVLDRDDPFLDEAWVEIRMLKELGLWSGTETNLAARSLEAAR